MIQVKFNLVAAATINKTLVDPLHPLINILLGSQGYRHTHLVSASLSPVIS